MDPWEVTGLCVVCMLMILGIGAFHVRKSFDSGYRLGVKHGASDERERLIDTAFKAEVHAEVAKFRARHPEAFRVLRGEGNEEPN